MTLDNGLWGAERIQGELLKLGFSVAASTIQGYDRKLGQWLDAVARGAGIRVIRTPKMAPKANAHCERAIGSVRRECIDHILIFNQRHRQLVLDEYRGYFNASRPHQGIDQRCPSGFDASALGRRPPARARVVAKPILGGLHHTYEIAA
jgi:hypothetical protein